MIVRREIVHGKPWLGVPQIVVEDSEGLLVTFTPTGAPFGFATGPWPTPTGRHPWFPNKVWKGHGTLHLMRPGDSYAVWVFWEGSQREFAGWYINIQEPFRRTVIGYDTQDLELDLIVEPNGSWSFKDLELLEARVTEGRLTRLQVSAIRDEGARIAAELRAGHLWWDLSWASWQPDLSWPTPSLRRGWSRVKAQQAVRTRGAQKSVVVPALPARRRPVTPERISP